MSILNIVLMTGFNSERGWLLSSKQLPESLPASVCTWATVAFGRPQRPGQCGEAKDAWKKGGSGHNLQRGQNFGNRPGETKASISIIRVLSGFVVEISSSLYSTVLPCNTSQDSSHPGN